MIIFNEKEIQGKYVLWDNMLLVINSNLSMEEIYEKLRKDEPLTNEEVSINAYLNGDGKIKLESNDYEEKATIETITMDRYGSESKQKRAIGVGAILEEDVLEEIAEVDKSKVYVRDPFFDAYEKVQFGSKREGYELKKFPFDITKPQHKEVLRKHIAIGYGAMSTFFNDRDLTLDEIKRLGKSGANLYRDFGKGSVSNDNPLPTKEEILVYEALSDYEKRLIATNTVHPKVVMELKASLGGTAVLTNDLYRKLAFFKGDVEKVVNARTHDVTQSLVDRFTTAFQNSKHKRPPRVLKEYIQGLMDFYKLKKEDFTDEKIEEFVSKFKLEGLQTKISDKVTVALAKNPSLLAMTNEMNVQEIPQQLLRAMAVYIDQNNANELRQKGIVNWLKKNKNTNVSDFVEMLDALDIIEKFDENKSAKDLKKTLDIELGLRDAKLFENKYSFFKWNENEIAIKGRHLMVEDGAYRMYMLAPDDPRNFVSGYDTCCCQRWDNTRSYHDGGKNMKIQVLKSEPSSSHNAGGMCVVKLASDPYAANVVIEKKSTGEIVGQSFVWVDVAKDIFVFDNIEYANDGKSSKYTNIIGLYAKHIPYSEVHLGMGCNDNQKLNGVGKVVKNEEVAKMPTTINDQYCYTDYCAGSAKIIKEIDGRTKAPHMVKYPLDESRCRVTTRADEPTKWDEMANGPFAFLLNDCHSTVEQRFEMMERFKTNPDEALQRQIIERDPRAILAVENPSAELQMYVWGRNKEVAKEIKNPCVELQVAILAEDPGYLRKGVDVPEEVVVDVLKQNGLLLSYIPKEKITTPMCEAALESNGYAWKSIPLSLKTEELAMICAKSAPKMISMMEKEFVTENVQMEATRKDPGVVLLTDCAIRAQMSAVSKRPELVLSLEKPEYPVVRVAIQKQPTLIKKFQFQFPSLRMEAIERNGFVAKDLNGLTVAEYNAAVNQNPNVARFVKNPSEVVEQVSRTTTTTRETPSVDVSNDFVIE